MPRADRLSLTLDHQRGVGCVGYVWRRIGPGQGMTQIPSVAIPALQRLAAAELFVEQSTVKIHLIHLYSKLGVHRRTQAVARARALKLLD